MPYLAHLPTTPARRKCARAATVLFHGRPAMMFYRPSHLTGSRLNRLQMEGRAWPNTGSSDTNDTRDPPEEGAGSGSWPYGRELRPSTAVSISASAFTSPIYSQHQRASFASPQQTDAARRRLETDSDGEQKQAAEDAAHDPFSNMNATLRTLSSSYEEDPHYMMGMNAQMNAQMNAHSHAAAFATRGDGDEAAYHPFFEDGMVNPLNLQLDGHGYVMATDDAPDPPADLMNPNPPAMNLPALNLPYAQAQAAPPVGAAPMRMRIAASRRGTGRRVTRPPTRLQQRGPSSAEIASCNTRRASQALQTWYDRYNELNEYRRIHGHCNVPQKHAPNAALGIWVNKMRMEKKRYDEDERSALSQEKIDALEAIDFAWAKQKGEHLWEEKFVDLVAYKNRHGHCNVPTKFKTDSALGRWVSTQRKQYKDFHQPGKKSLMTLERIQRLNQIHFSWSMMGDHDDSTTHM